MIRNRLILFLNKENFGKFLLYILMLNLMEESKTIKILIYIRTGRIGIKESDNAEEVAHSFAKIY